MSPAQNIPSRRAALGALVLTAVLFLGLVFFFFDPARHSFYPACMLNKMTGLHCPGCGGLRALHQLTHGNIVTAFRCNPLFIALLPFILILGIRWLTRGPQAFASRTILFRPAMLWTLLAVTVLFTILRNLPSPAFAWMSP
jgi:hypothetical protein